jgi:hypothetical protein
LAKIIFNFVSGIPKPAPSMSLNDIQLPEFIIGEWFKDNLMVAPARPNPAADPQQPASKPRSATQSIPPGAPESNYGEFATIKSNTTPTPPSLVAPTPPSPTPAPPTHTANQQTPAPTTAAQGPPTALKHLGNNRRHITLLVNAHGSAFLPDTQLNFLTKIIEACRMTIADVAIVNHAATPATITTLKEQLHPKILLLFGIESTTIRLPINFPAFRQMDYDSCTLLAAPPLEQLVPNTEESKLLKSKLWVCLKTLFDV